jgi:hypothetical protein
MIAAPVGVVASAVGGLAAVGLLGRVERNDPEAFTLTVGAVVVAGVMFAFWGALQRKNESIWLRGLWLVAVLLAAGGIIRAAGLAVGSAGHTERPIVNVEVDPSTMDVSGKVSVGNVPSDQRLVVLVDGLKRQTIKCHPSDKSQWRAAWKPNTLFQAYVGPDGEGKLELPIKLRLKPGRFGAIGIKAYVSKPVSRGATPALPPLSPFCGQSSDATSSQAAGRSPVDASDAALTPSATPVPTEEEPPCERYPVQVSTFPTRRERIGAGCLVVTLPTTTANPAPEASK